MKRNMDLIRALLLKVESDPPPRAGETATGFDVAGYTDAEVLYHLDLLAQAEFVSGDARNSKVVDVGGQPTRVALYKLTWQGHEFLDSVRDPETWKKAKEG